MPEIRYPFSFNVFYRFLENILGDIGIHSRYFSLDATIVKEILDNHQQDLIRFEDHYGADPDIFKISGYMTFWIKKLRPITFKNGRQRIIQGNASVAVMVGLHIINSDDDYNDYLTRLSDLRNNNFIQQLMAELIRDLTYRLGSPHMISSVYKSLAVGIDYSL